MAKNWLRSMWTTQIYDIVIMCLANFTIRTGLFAWRYLWHRRSIQSTSTSTVSVRNFPVITLPPRASEAKNFTRKISAGNLYCFLNFLLCWKTYRKPTTLNFHDLTCQNLLLFLVQCHMFSNNLWDQMPFYFQSWFKFYGLFLVSE